MYLTVLCRFPRTLCSVCFRYPLATLSFHANWPHGSSCSCLLLGVSHAVSNFATSPLNEASLELWLVGAIPFQPFQLWCSKGEPTLGSGPSGPSGSSSSGCRPCTPNTCSTWSIQCVIAEVPGVARFVIHPAMVKAPERVSRCGGHGLLLGHACFGLGSCCGCHRLHSLCHWYEDSFKPCSKEKGRGCRLLFTVASLILYEEPMWDEALRREIRKGLSLWHQLRKEWKKRYHGHGWRWHQSTCSYIFYEKLLARYVDSQLHMKSITSPGPCLWWCLIRMLLWTPGNSEWNILPCVRVGAKKWIVKKVTRLLKHAQASMFFFGMIHCKTVRLWF